MQEAQAAASSRSSEPVARDALRLLPIVAAAALAWAVQPAATIVDDSYFYLVIARNLALHGQQTFSNIVPTNGFHPLWQYMLGGWDWLLARVHPAWLESPAVPLLPAAVCLFVGALALTRAARALQLSPILVVGPPLAFIAYMPVCGSEAHVHFACLAIVAWACVTDRPSTPRGAWWTGLACGLLVLARLDEAMLCAATLLWHFRRFRQPRLSLRLGAGMALVVVPYLTSNLWFFGGLMPVSGWMKSSFPHVFLRGLEWQGTLGIGTTLGGVGILSGIVPLAVSLAILARRGVDVRASWIRQALLVGVLAMTAYLVLFTRSHTHWFWYYVSHVTLLGFALGVLAREAAILLRWQKPVAALVFVVIAAAMLVRASRPQLDRSNRLIVALRERLQPNEGLIASDYPGFLAFYSERSVFAPDLLTANRLFYKQMLESGHPLQFVLTTAQRAGHPLRLILLMGADWLRSDGDELGVSYVDPRTFPRVELIDHLALPHAPVELYPNGPRLWALGQAR